MKGPIDVKTIGWATIAVATAMLVGALGAVQPAVAATAPAVSGAVVVYGDSLKDSSSPKRAVALCPLNKRVIGGGGAVRQAVVDDPVTRIPALMQLTPVERYIGTRDAYIAVAAETPPIGIEQDW
jgi:hypothetical protein